MVLSWRTIPPTCIISVVLPRRTIPPTCIISVILPRKTISPTCIISVSSISSCNFFIRSNFQCTMQHAIQCRCYDSIHQPLYISIMYSSLSFNRVHNIYSYNDQLQYNKSMHLHIIYHIPNHYSSRSLSSFCSHKYVHITIISISIIIFIYHVSLHIILVNSYSINTF